MRMMEIPQTDAPVRLSCAWLCTALALGALSGCGGSEEPSDGTQSSSSASSSSLTEFQGGFAYAVSNGPDGASVASFSVGADGSLTSGAQGPVSIPGTSADVVADPSGRYVYTINLDPASNYSNNSISQFAVTSSGDLTPLSPASVALPDVSCVAYAATVDPAGHFLYLVCLESAQGQSVVQFALESDGTLSPLNPAYVSLTATTAAPRPNHLVLDSSGLNAYLASGNQVLHLTVASDGTLSSPAATPVAAVQSVSGFALAPDGQHAYVLGPTTSCGALACSGSVSLYTVNSTGELAATTTLLTIGGQQVPVQLLFDPADSTNAYLLTSEGQSAGVDAVVTGTLVQYSVDSSGMLSPATGSAAASFDYAPLEASIFGSSVYVLGTPPGPAISPPSGLGSYGIGSMGLLTAGPVTAVPGLATGVAFVAAQ